MFLLVEKRRWKDLAGSVSPSLSDESSPAMEGVDLIETAASFPAIGDQISPFQELGWQSSPFSSEGY